MCTAVTYRTHDHYFGRNLDLPSSYQETVTITPGTSPYPSGGPASGGNIMPSSVWLLWIEAILSIMTPPMKRG